MRRQKPSFSIEDDFWTDNNLVIGIDEVGRGPLAGPVTVGAVCFGSPNEHFRRETVIELGINDSKIITENKREKLSPFIKKSAVAYTVLSGSVDEINRFGIALVLNKLITKAAETLIAKLPKIHQSAVIIDGIYAPQINGIDQSKVKSVIDGDALSYSIAAASIIAKVDRDTYMKNLSAEFPMYGWEKNKGYGTKEHMEALKKYGASPHHRRDFINKL